MEKVTSTLTQFEERIALHSVDRIKLEEQLKALLDCATVRTNPSVKGTSCGKPQSALYVER